MKYTEMSSTITISSNSCDHNTGWYGNVTIKWLFGLMNKTVKIYACSLCGEVLYGKALKEFNSEDK